jgi:hypothetical protein
MLVIVDICWCTYLYRVEIVPIYSLLRILGLRLATRTA